MLWTVATVPVGVTPQVLARALAASWDDQTAYRGVIQPGNAAFGQCYPTSRVVQWFYPEYEIAKGTVWTGSIAEQHFWNVRGVGESVHVLDLTWSQFPPNSIVQDFILLDRKALGDSPGTVERCEQLLKRVLTHLSQR